MHFFICLVQFDKVLSNFLCFIAILVNNSAQNYIKQNSVRTKQSTFRRSWPEGCASSCTALIVSDILSAVCDSYQHSTTSVSAVYQHSALITTAWLTRAGGRAHSIWSHQLLGLQGLMRSHGKGLIPSEAISCRARMDIMQNSVTFFSTSELIYTNFKTGPNKSKNM